MKKNYLSMLTVMMAAMLSVCFVSCNNNDGGGGGGGNVVSKEAEKFVGGWRNVYSSVEGFLFLSDGTCSEFFMGEYLSDWSYDENTKKLATTMKGNSWTISMLTANAWTGFSEKDVESQTYERHNEIYLITFMDLMESWRGSLEQYLDQGYSFKYMMPGDNVMASSENVKISSNVIEASNVQLFAYKDVNDINDHRPNEQIVFTGKVTINNYGKINAKMTIEGTIPATGDTFKKEYNAAAYIKDKKVVSVEE